MSEDFVRNGGALEAHADHLRASKFAAFADGIGNFAGLSEADTDATASIANDDKSAEIETTATFNNLGGTVDEDDFFGQLLFLAFEVVVGVGATATRAHAVATPSGWFGAFDGTFDNNFWFIAVLRRGWFGHNIILHGTLEFQTSFAGRIGEGLDLSVVASGSAVKYDFVNPFFESGFGG